MSTPVVHLAAPAKDLVQRCSLCGEVLIDNRNASAQAPWEPHWYEGAVAKGANYSAATTDPPNCSRRVGH